VCAMLDKPERIRSTFPIDYLGFSIPDYFVVGYGLDIDEKGRNFALQCLRRFGEVQKVERLKENIMPITIRSWDLNGETKVRAVWWTCFQTPPTWLPRFNGGDNAGHTVTVGQTTFKLQPRPPPDHSRRKPCA